MTSAPDLAIVGAGIVGLAHALAAAKRGLKVAVLDRDPQVRGASIQNFGFVTVTGQAEGDTRRRALRSRDVWAQVAPQAGIAVLQRGALIVARRPEARELLAAYAAGPHGEGCELHDAIHARRRWPMLAPGLSGALWSPHELRVEPREALPRLARWLEEAHGVAFHRGMAVTGIDSRGVHHAEGTIAAGSVIAAPGAGLRALFPGVSRRAGLRECRLQMLRTVPQPPAFRLDSVLMSDLSLVRYEGFAALRPAAALRARLEADAGESLARGVHLIVAQGADGALVVGDSHDYAQVAEPFSLESVDALILDELDAVLDLPRPGVAERWMGVYPVADVAPLLREAVADRIRVVVVTSGTGMSTAFAIGEETVAELFG
ncbi:MAG: TIGR03364 family FAD-dependent oxidoreductase [Betaproteobacteria bacterium]|nr:TIGR03364 family FAD-dependent oxidoreductase [Betaproteobacteria bacterium]